MHISRFLCSAATLAVAVLSLVAPAARADVLVDTFDAGSFTSGGNLVAAFATRTGSSYAATRLAVRFTTPAGNGGGYTLDSVTMPLSQVLTNVSTNLLRVRLAGDANGGLPGGTIEVLSLNQAVPAATSPFTTTTTLSSSSHPLLASATRYWLITELSSLPSAGASNYSADFRWWLNTSGASPSVFIQQQVNTATLPADPWPASNGSFQLAYRVNGTPILPAACCNTESGACASIFAAACQSLGLAAQGTGSVCSPNPCAAFGACCHGTTCATSTAGGCVSGGTFLGAGAACNPVGRNGGMNACCPADFSNSGGIEVADIFLYLNSWFAFCP